MRWAVLLGLCACNPIFGLETTELIRPDAALPPSCPVIGGIPRFRNALAQVRGARKCNGFGVDETQTTAAAMCTDDSYASKFAAGTVADGLTMQTMTPDVYFNGMRTTPEGTIFAQLWEDVGNYTWAFRIHEYAPTESSWQQIGPAMDLGGWVEFSNPSRGPDRHMVGFLSDAASTQFLAEFVWNGTAWTEAWREPLTSYLTSEITRLYQPSLTPDGLHLVFGADSLYVGGGGYGSGSGYGSGGPPPPVTQTDGTDLPMDPIESPIVYLDRGSLDAKFLGPTRVITSVPGGVSWPHLTEDCGRLYFSALDSVWYVNYSPE